jgi:S-adenosylmethionine:tRNA ribosyltransferase-isomerase
MRLSDFEYELPPELIAQAPAPEREASRLLVLDRSAGRLEHRRFADVASLLGPGDVVVVNDTRVVPARLFGTYPDGRPVEVLFLRRTEGSSWEALVKPAKFAREGQRLLLADGTLPAVVAGSGRYGRRRLRLPESIDLRAVQQAHGVMPLPPYIKRSTGHRAPGAEESEAGTASPLEARRSALDTDRERYQTVYARVDGAVAAPTAGLHFTPGLLARLQQAGVTLAPITLHVGPGTFQPVRTEEIAEHRMEPEWFRIPETTAAAVRTAKREGGRVVAVGTTCVRTLEYVAGRDGLVQAGEGEADLFITPGYPFRVVDALITNFHLPRSTLLMLVAAFAGLEPIRRAYAEAVRERYRFYSYGDAMFIR